MRRPFLVLSLVAATACQATDPVPPAELIVHNAIIYTANDVQPRVEAVAVRGGRFVVVGTNADAMKLRGPHTRIVDAGGRAVLPGLQDTHGRFTALGKSLQLKQQGRTASMAVDRSDAQLEAQILLAEGETRRLGLTMVHDAGASPREVAAYKRLIDQGRLKTRLYVMLAGSLETLTAEFKKGPIKDYGNRHLSVQAIESVADDPDEAYAKTLAAARAGFQSAIHATGDHTNHQVLDTFEKVAAVVPGARDLRQRLEHEQILDERDLPRLKALNVIASTQAMHADPIPGLYAALTRQDRAEALKSFTWRAAYAAHAEQDLGSIERGKYADLVVIDRDVMTVEPAQILGTTVVLTVVGGEVVFEKQP